MTTFPPRGLVAELCEQVVAHDLPELPADRRQEVVEFAGRRIAGLPSPMRLAVGAVAGVVGGVGKLTGTGRIAGLLARHPLPVAREYVRLVRSLAYAYVWETWPDTAPTGRPLPELSPESGRIRSRSKDSSR